jgi:hypothetical protein
MLEEPAQLVIAQVQVMIVMAKNLEQRFIEQSFVMHNQTETAKPHWLAIG